MIAIFLLGIIPPLLLFLAVRLDARKPVAHPLKVMGWILLIAYTLKSLYLVYAIPAGLSFRTDYFTADHIPLGQSMVLLAVVFMIMGYFLADQLRLRFPSLRIKGLTPWIAQLYWPIFF